ncbi:MAG: histone deacetylase [Actinomycetota bacterium]|nr:histone deacetylase [Actinomycetota bacterium]
MEHIWYASYGSNMSARRFHHYLQGGRPEGASRDYPGARNTSLPSAVAPVTLSGSVFFAWESPTWGGGIAFYDAAGRGTSYGRAYLLTAGQFADVAAQEMHRVPDTDLDLTALWADGHVLLGPGRYERLLVVGEIEHAPVVTFTASWTQDDAERNPPVAAYLRTMAVGLREGHNLDDEAVVEYLLARPGVSPPWTRAGLTTALGIRPEA